MSENATTEDEVISQDDIDKLLNASIADEDETDADNTTDAGTTTDADNDLAELSQDDIDSLLNGAPLGPEASENKVKDEDSDGLELVSQDDIDQLMDTADSSNDSIDSSIESIVDTEIDDDDDLDFISRDDVKQLMNKDALPDDGINSSSGTDVSAVSPDTELLETSETETAPEGSEKLDELELISQDDIDKLMNGEFQESTKENQNSDEETPEILPSDESKETAGIDETSDTKEDLAALHAHEQSAEYDKEPDLSGDRQVDEQAIDEAEALDVEDCLITQETIDQLIKKDMEEPVRLPEQDQQQEPEPEPEPEQGPEPEPEQGQEQDPEQEKGEKGEYEQKKQDEPEDVTQDDIDEILERSEKETDDVSNKESNLISQDEINKLLEGTEEEDEDILGDVDEISTDEGVNIENDSDADLKEEVSKEEDQVILEKVKEDETDQIQPDPAEQIETEGKKKQDNLKKKWYRSRLVAAGLGIVFILIIFSGGYIFFFHGSKAIVKIHNLIARGESGSGTKVQTRNINSDSDTSVLPQGPGTMAMKDFIVLSPEKNKRLSYIAVDISIYYSQGSVRAEIKKQLPFYRGVIYDALKNFLAGKKQVSEKNISETIKNALNQVMHSDYIDHVALTDFKTG